MKVLKTPFSDAQIYHCLNSIVGGWFKETFGQFSAPQQFAIPLIRNRENLLISSPTGSGKTLCAFTSILNELIDLTLAGELKDQVYCVYISPLKSLSRDIEKNLLEPLGALEARAGQSLKIRIMTRTGDTSKSERAKMSKSPPHILVTTPESLAILLTSPKFSEYFGHTQWVIVDEIHAMAAGKRGTHLALTLERLANRREFCRIGLSATVAPLEEVAKYLVGRDKSGEERPCTIVDTQHIKQLDLQVISPVQNLVSSSFQQIQEATYTLMDNLISAHTTTLIFTNTRAATERVVHHLKARFPSHYAIIEDSTTEKPPSTIQGVDGAQPLSRIAAHHSSLSKDHRVRIETQLRAGQLKAVVCSTSLELGIDIGFIDLVILLGSPKSVARALQRIGRSGHRLHDQAKGRIIVLDRDDLVECSILLKSAIERKIDTISIPKNCLDVLAQQVFGFALEGSQPIDHVFQSVKRAYPYHNLTWEEFYGVVKYLAGEHVSLEERHVYSKIWYDEETQMIGKRGKMARVLYMTNVGTIPDETNVSVRLGQYIIGSITEPFLERLKRGDVFVLGGDAYEFQYGQGLTAIVKASAGRMPTVPSWFSEMLPLSYDLALDIAVFRRLLCQHIQHGSKKETLDFLSKYLYADQQSLQSIYEYFSQQAKFSTIPHDREIVIEQFVDGKKHFHVFHTLYGRRVNDVLSRCVAMALGRIHHRDIEIGITDNGFYAAALVPLQAKRALTLIKSHEIRAIAEQSLEKTEVLARRFRHCAARGLMILRNYQGRTKSVGRQQMSSRMLLTSVRRISPNFPILQEARREILEDFMDIEHAKEVINAIEQGRIKLTECHTDLPSPFAFGLVLQGYMDILKMEDRQQFLLRMHQMVLAKISLKEARKADRPSESSEAISYQTLWRQQELDAQNAEKHIAEEELSLQDQLMQDLSSAARRIRMDPQLKWDLERLIKGEREGLKPETVTFIQELLRGSIPKLWTDRIVKFFKSVQTQIS